MNISMLYSSKNDYHVLEEILYKKSFKSLNTIYTMNVDCGSTAENKRNGLGILNKYGVVDLVADQPVSIPMVKCVEMAIQHLDEVAQQTDWLMVVQHDVYFPQIDFLTKLEVILNNHPEFLEKVGTIGFAVQNLPTEGKFCYGRGNLLEGTIGSREGFLTDLPESYLNSEYFVTECSWYVAWLINIKLFKKFIKPDYDYVLNFWGDDIAHQFMMNNVFNITVPSLHVVDDWRYKTTLGVPHCNKAYDTFFQGDHWQHVSRWYNKYGYHMFYPDKNYEKSKNDRLMTYSMVQYKYYDTLIDKMFNKSVNDGPLTLKDLE